MDIFTYNQEGLRPGVTLNPELQVFEIVGKSCPENVVEFYKPILDWFDKYSENPNEKTIFEFKLEYYNTASSKMLYVVMQKLEHIKEKGKEVHVRWFYPDDDEALEEAGEEYKELIDLPFELIPFNSEE
ncbi:MAG: DUF1987 domain-containing protein [Bacteroidales bacterium]|nr:DUF1987 domain-containing protein [Bacteroidales bacterium]MBN2758044.1 DUF1987 domain-containing protein [Bacteroidales bacterium]